MRSKSPVRKREKRKQQKSVILDDLLASSSPEQLIERAVRVDEMHRSQSILREPLESVRLYDTEKFIEALQYLREYRPSKELPRQALTPIIVSGLLSTALQCRSTNETPTLGTSTLSTNSTTEITANHPLPTVAHNSMSETFSPDLVLQSQSMRTAAIYRLRHRARRLQQATLLLLSLVVLSFSLGWCRARRKLHFLVEGGSSCDAMPAYAPACRLAEATVWWTEQFGKRRSRSGSTHMKLHTTLEQDLIPWEEVAGTVAPKPANRKANGKYSSDDSVSYQLALDALLASPRVDKESKQFVLDVGCGVGGFSHAVPGSWKYHGVSASLLEIEVARQSANENAYFYQQSFDRPFPVNSYTAAIAIDSLSFSRHLADTLQQIVSSLAPGGVLVVMDDVIDIDLSGKEEGSSVDEEPGSTVVARRPSLVAHSTWMTSLAESGCNVTTARDLSSEYEVRMDQELSFFLTDWRVLGTVAAIDLVTVFERWHLTNNPKSQRLIELIDELDEIGHYWKHRRHGYEASSQLYYHMYVCVKV